MIHQDDATKGYTLANKVLMRTTSGALKKVSPQYNPVIVQCVDSSESVVYV